jgi:hypothetical protein
MAAQFRVQVFGKEGCDKCGVLNQRLDKMLGQQDWSAFEKQYWDVETEDGIVAFAEAECINPQRIPALLVARRNPQTDEYEPITNPAPGRPDPVYKKSKLYQYLGVQTDYTDTGRGVISPRMIKKCLEEALAD